MSIFSSIKQTLHNRKLKQADECVLKGDYDKAEDIYKSLIPYHPEAVTHLAEMLLNYPDTMDIQHYTRILDCRFLLINDISNFDSFEQIEKSVFNEIESIIDSLLDEKKYHKVTVWIEFILSRNKNLTQSQKKVYLLLDSKCRYNYALGLIKNDRKRAEKIFEDIYKKSESYSFPLDYISKIRNKILNIAKTYANESDLINSNHFFRLILDKDPLAKELFIKNNILNINQIKSEPSAIHFLFETIKSIEDKTIVANYFEQLAGKIPEAGEQYILSIISVSTDYINNEEFSKALNVLDSALSKKADNRLYDLQRDIAQKYISQFNYDAAIKILSKLTGNHGDAEPLLANCYLKKAEKANGLDEKRAELLKAFKFKEAHAPLFTSVLYNEIFPKIVDNLLAISKKYASYEYFQDAYDLLSMLFPYTQDAYEEYINTRLLEICKNSNENEQISLLDELVRFGKQKIKNAERSKAIDTIITTLIDKKLSLLSKEQNTEIKINELTKLNRQINNESFLSSESALQLIQQKLAEIYYEKGKSFEKISKINDAITTYTKIINELKSWTNDVLQKNNVLGRIYICRLKEEGDINAKEIADFLTNEISNDIKRDLAYRFSVFLIKHQYYQHAWFIAQKYLPTTKETEKIKKIYEDSQISEAKKLLDVYNDKVQKLNDGILNLKDTLNFYQNLSETETKITTILTDIKGKIIANKDVIFAYILRKYFENEKYAPYLNIIQKQKNQFYKDANLLRNMAIASSGIIQTKQLNKNNYKEAISIWLTAVFCDRLFIKSLDYTSWDDNYSFTLYNSLGKMEEYADLPDNVNFDEPSSTNISIGDVQRSLLSSFEQDLNENCDSKILPQILEFYNEEKDAISQLYQAVSTNKDFFGCTPFFAENHPEIQTALNRCIDENLDHREFDEPLLNVGIQYKVEGKKYKNYSDSKILSAKGIEVVKAQNTAQIKLIFTVTNIKKIALYDELYEKLASDIQNCFNEQIHDDNFSYKNIISNYLIICKVFSDQNLKFGLSNFAYNECLKRLNNKSITPQEAIELLTEVQKVIQDNVKLNNLIPELKDIIIPNIQLSELIDNVNNNKISLLDGLTKNYDLYSLYPNHQWICENLVIICSNAIHSEIIGNTLSSSRVQSILNNIINNRSSTFKVAARELAIQYQTIMNSMPYDTKMLIAGIFVPGQSLNPKGEALKRGLNYLQRLSQ